MVSLMCNLHGMGGQRVGIAVLLVCDHGIVEFGDGSRSDEGLGSAEEANPKMRKSVCNKTAMIFLSR